MEENDTPVPLYKKVLCGNNPFGDFHYFFWRDLDCVCCAFFRGVLVGMFYALILYHMLNLVF